MDAPKFDAGGYVVGDTVTTATILCKSPGTMAGVPFVNAIFAHLGCTVEWLREEGATITEEESSNKLPVARVTGKTRCLLLGS